MARKNQKKKKPITIWCLPAKWCSGSRLVGMGFCVTGTILMGSLLGAIRCTWQAIVLTSASRLLFWSSQPDEIKTGQKCESSSLEIRTESGCTQLYYLLHTYRFFQFLCTISHSFFDFSNSFSFLCYFSMWLLSQSKKFKMSRPFRLMNLLNFGRTKTMRQKSQSSALIHLTLYGINISYMRALIQQHTVLITQKNGKQFDGFCGQVGSPAHGIIIECKQGGGWQGAVRGLLNNLEGPNWQH